MYMRWTFRTFVVLIVYDTFLPVKYYTVQMNFFFLYSGRLTGEYQTSKTFELLQSRMKALLRQVFSPSRLPR